MVVLGKLWLQKVVVCTFLGREVLVIGEIEF